MKSNECPQDKCFHWVAPGGRADMSGKTYKNIQEALKNAEETPMDDIKCPDLTRFALIAENCSNLSGDEFDTAKIINIYSKSLETVVNCINGKKPLPTGFRFFVPDFWHVALGRAQMMPRQDGQELWDAAVFGYNLGNEFFKDKTQLVFMSNDGVIFDFKDYLNKGMRGYPGTVYDDLK